MSAAKLSPRVTAPASGPITTTKQINADNARFWATLEANITQKEFAKLQSKIAIQAGHNRKRTQKATVGKIKKGKTSLTRAAAEMADYQTRGISKGRAADFIAPKIGLKSKQTERHLRKAGYKPSK